MRRSVESETEWGNTIARFCAGLAERQSGYPAYTHYDLLLAAVDFANGDPLAGALAQARDIPLPPAALPAIARESGEVREPSRHYEEFIERHRAALRENLTLAIGPGFSRAAFDVLQREAAQMLDPICSYEEVFTTSRRSRSLKGAIRHLRAKRVYLDYPLSGILAYIVLHQRDETLDHGHALRKCLLPGCDEPFFFSSTVGRACHPQLYCSPEHREEGNRLATRENMRARRAKHK